MINGAAHAGREAHGRARTVGPVVLQRLGSRRPGSEAAAEIQKQSRVCASLFGHACLRSLQASCLPTCMPACLPACSAQSAPRGGM